MKGLKGLIVIVILGLAGFTSCNKKILPGEAKKEKIATYDTSEFDYVYVEALKQKLLGNNGDAIKYLEKCIKINPGSDVAYYEIAQIAFIGGNMINAKKFALKSVELNERNIWYLTFLANIYYQEKNLDSAIILYEKAIKNFPEKEDLKLNLGNIYSEKGDYAKANEIFKYFENKYGTNENTTLYLIKGLMNSGDFKGAEEKVKILLQKSPDEVLYNGILAEIYRMKGEKENAFEIYKKLLEKDSENPQTLLSLSDFLITEKEYDELFNILNLIIINSKVTREDKITLMARLIENSELVKTVGEKLEISIIVLEATYKNDKIISLLRPDLYEKQNKTEMAVERLEEIIKIDSENYYAWEKLLVLYSEKGDYDNLFNKGKECATKFNMSFPAKILYASAAIEKNEYDIAEEELKKARIIAGNDKEMIVQVLTMDADLFYRKKEFLKSYQTFEEALKLSPENIMIMNNYAYYLAEQGEELKEAERMAKKVIETEKNNGTYLDTYAWILYKRGKIREAAKIMEDIIKDGEKEDAEWCEHFGFIMKAMKKCDKAVEYWKKAQIMDLRKDYLSKEIQNCSK